MKSRGQIFRGNISNLAILPYCTHDLCLTPNHGFLILQGLICRVHLCEEFVKRTITILMIFIAMTFPGCSESEGEKFIVDPGGKPMADISRIDYSSLDCPEVINLLFHPRPEGPVAASLKNTRDMFIPVEGGLFIGARLHHTDKGAPIILFFHGNGEIVSDYDDLGPIYSRIGINFLPVDYRGYGRSTGSPTVTGMMRDCHVVFA